MARFISVAGLKVVAVRDYKTGLRDDGKQQTNMGLPQSDVLYYELEDGAWVCVRPSGTEPKIKVYANAFAPCQKDAEALTQKLIEQTRELLA